MTSRWINSSKLRHHWCCEQLNKYCGQPCSPTVICYATQPKPRWDDTSVSLSLLECLWLHYWPRWSCHSVWVSVSVCVWCKEGSIFRLWRILALCFPQAPSAVLLVAEGHQQRADRCKVCVSMVHQCISPLETPTIWKQNFHILPVFTFGLCCLNCEPEIVLRELHTVYSRCIDSPRPTKIFWPFKWCE